jgi:NhaA family Na+:H+ antiporter
MKTALFTTIEEKGIPLIFGIVCAMIFCNFGDYEYYLQITEHPLMRTLDLKEIANTIFPILPFFGLAMIEIVKAFGEGGSLHDPKAAANALFATAGDVLGPIFILLAMAFATHKPDLYLAPGVVFPADIALGLVVMTCFYSKNHPIVPIVLMIAVLDDLAGILVMVTQSFSPDDLFKYIWLLMPIIGVGLTYLMKVKKVDNLVAYILPAGLSWAGLYMANIEPALALVPLVPFVPHTTTEKFEHLFARPVTYGLFLFGFTSVGLTIDIHSLFAISTIIFLIARYSKIFWLPASSWIATKCGFPMPAGVTSRDMTFAGFGLCINTTVGVIVAEQVFAGTKLLANALLSLVLSLLQIPLSLGHSTFAPKNQEKNNHIQLTLSVGA